MQIEMNNTLVSRIEEIHKRLTKLDESCHYKDIIGYEPTRYRGETITTSRTFIFDTVYGKRQILCDKHFLAYGEIGFWHYLKGYGKFGESYILCDDAFFIIEYLHEYEIFGEKHPASLYMGTPKNVGMTEKEIDLAILEAENKIEKLYLDLMK